MPAVRLDILSLVPPLYRQCAHCETLYGQAGIGDLVQSEMMGEYPTDLMDEHVRLSEWVRDWATRYAGVLQIRVIDPHSGLGLWKSLRHGVRKYPAFIVNGREKVTGWHRQQVDEMLSRALAAGGRSA
jgi:hypothetical protein